MFNMYESHLFPPKFTGKMMKGPWQEKMPVSLSVPLLVSTGGYALFGLSDCREISVFQQIYNSYMNQATVRYSIILGMLDTRST